MTIHYEFTLYPILNKLMRRVRAEHVAIEHPRWKFFYVL